MEETEPKPDRTRLTLKEARIIRASNLTPAQLAIKYNKHVHTIRRILWNQILKEKTVEELYGPNPWG